MVALKRVMNKSEKGMEGFLGKGNDTGNILVFLYAILLKDVLGEKIKN